MLLSQKIFGFISWLLKEGLCGSSWLPTPPGSKIKISVCASCTAWAGIAFWQDLHTQAIPRASLMSLSNNSEQKGEAKACNSSLIQFQDHFPKAEAAAAFWSETSIAGACARKKCYKYAWNVSLPLMWSWSGNAFTGNHKDTINKNILISQTSQKLYRDLCHPPEQSYNSGTAIIPRIQVSALIPKHHIPDSNLKIKELEWNTCPCFSPSPTPETTAGFLCPLGTSTPPEKHKNHSELTELHPHSASIPCVDIKLKIKFCSASKLSSFAQGEQSRAAESCRVRSLPLPSPGVFQCHQLRRGDTGVTLTHSKESHAAHWAHTCTQKRSLQKQPQKKPQKTPLSDFCRSALIYQWQNQLGCW